MTVTLTMNKDVVRRMNRAQYKAAMRWVRIAQRAIRQNILGVCSNGC